MSLAPDLANSPFRCISAREAAQMLTRHLEGELPALALFDVRDAESYDRAHLPGAVNLSMKAFPRVISKIPRTTPVLVYCYHGNSSQTYAAMFADFRFAEVYSVDGGYPHFAEALLSGGDEAPAIAAPQATTSLKAFLTEFGLDVNDLEKPGAQGLTPLMRAAYEARPDLVEELLAAGVSPSSRNADGNNALWLACVAECVPAAELLVKAGVDRDNRNETGASCLMYAASAGKARMVEFLLAAGADPHLRNFDDVKAVDLASTLACLKLLRHTVD